MIRRLHSLLWLAAFSGSAFAQSYAPGTADFLDWPSNLGNGDFGRSVSARLTGDERHHVVVLKGNVPVLLLEPSAFESFMDLSPIVPPNGFNANDIDVLPHERNEASVDHDVLVVVRGAGLDLLSHDGSNWQLTAVDHTTRYQNAVQVRVRDTNHDARFDIVVLCANHRTIRIKLQQADGSFADDPAGPMVVANDVLDFDVLEFDGTVSSADYALNTTAGLDVRTRDGTLLHAVTSLRPDLDCMAIVRGATGVLDQVAYCTAANASPTSTTQNLILVRLAGESFQAETADIVHLAAGDLNGDDRWDLVAAMAAEHEVVTIYNQDSHPTFNPALADSWHVELLPNGTSESVAFPLIADVTNDRDNDLVLPINGSQQVLLLSGPLGTGNGSEEYGGSGITSVVDFVHLGPDGAGTCLDDVGEGVLGAFPEAYFQGLNVLGSDWRIETKVYSVPYLGSTMTPESRCVSPLSFPTTVNTQTVEIGFESPNADSPDEQQNITYLWYLRLVRVSGPSETIVEARPALMGALCKLDHGLIDAVKYPGWDYELVYGCPGPEIQGLPRVDGFVRMRRFPSGLSGGLGSTSHCAVHAH